MAKKLTQKEVEEKISKLYNGEYKLISNYTLSTEPITLLHKPCNNKIISKRAKDFLNEGKNKCPYCNEIKSHSTKRLTEENVKEQISKIDNNTYKYLSGFINSHTKCKIKHNVCGNEFEVTPHMFLGSKATRCPYCMNKNRGKYAIKENYLNSILNEKSYGNDYIWLEEYKNNNKLKHKILHKVCNTTYKVRPNDFQQGYLCPHCTSQSSKGEIEVLNFIKDNCKYHIINHYRINNKEIDIFIKELNIGFEFNGYYWHSDKFKDKNFHINKKNFFKNLGIDIYFIDEIDWKSKKNIIKNKILHIIHSRDLPRIYARNTEIVYNIKPKIKRSFLNRTHIQGYCNDNFSIGLKYNKRLVALMTFGFNRLSLNNKNKRLELIRYSTSNNFIIVGGFSKLLKHAMEYFLNNESYSDFSEIYTFADLSWSNGNIYLKNGFELDHISKPSYYFIYKGKKFNRFSFRKSNLKELFPEYYNENKTESEITSEIPNVYKIWNCGNLVFKYTISPSK